MTLRESYASLPWPAKALVIAIPVIGIGAILYDLVTGGGHDTAPWADSGIREVHVCPSALDGLLPLHHAAQDWERRTTCDVPTVTLDPCTDLPGDGEAQVRGCHDLVSLQTPQGVAYSAGCPAGYADTVGHHPTAPRAVAYWDILGDRPGTAAHILGHIDGHGHTTAGGSVMASQAGTRWTYVGCGGSDDF
jgi:hypothetical protein